MLKEASENWKLEVIRNLESRTSLQRPSALLFPLLFVSLPLKIQGWLNMPLRPRFAHRCRARSLAVES